MKDVVATTKLGQIRGVNEEGVVAFKGIRYAKPPTGPLRFMPPVPTDPWEGVLEAGELGPSCPQPEQRPAGWSHEVEEDEDCLRLNVWTPSLDNGGRPVMVWFHGGGYSIGSGSWPVYDGASLTRRGDVVVVTVNHRLGPLGYLHLGELGGPELMSSGNAGMLDLVAVLRWVRDHIAAFGGDAGNVTIFGESGGGAKVSTLLAMPAARGLFHRAAIQSGPGRYVLSKEQAAKSTAALLRALDIPEGPDAVKRLRELPAEALVKGSGPGLAAGGERMAFSPVLDGEHVPMHPADGLRSGQAANVPLIIGSNLDEATLFMAGHPALADRSLFSEEDLKKALAAFGKRADRLYEVYRQNRPEATPFDVLLAIRSDATMRIPSIKLAERRRQHAGGAPVYLYLFCWAAGPMGAGHGFELPFMFDNIHEPVMRPSPNRKELAARMSEAWLAFARTGDPNHDGLPNWPAYALERRATMRFDRGECRVVDDPAALERQVWFE